LRAWEYRVVRDFRVVEKEERVWVWRVRREVEGLENWEVGRGAKRRV